MTEQLTFDIVSAPGRGAARRPTGRPLSRDAELGLASHQRIHEVGGTGRLLRTLVRQGLQPDAYRAAAALVVELDIACARSSAALDDVVA